MIRKTKSVCPVCLTTLDAELSQSESGEMILSKTCPEHGNFSSVVWRGEPNYFDWTRKQIEHEEKNLLRPLHMSSKECPQNCGLCPEHKQSTCTVLLELTQQCNLSCQICFANSQKYYPCAEHTQDKLYIHNEENLNSTEKNTLYTHFETQAFVEHPPSFDPLDSMLKKIDWIHKAAGHVILQLSGGEPTLYPHLLDVVSYASSLFPAVQLNTNGILLASDKNLAKNLKKAGLSWVFLQFDAPNDDVNIVLRGQKLLNIKNKAIENCKEAGLSVVLVSVLVRGVNDHKIEELLQFALQNYPVIRGIHFQPMTKSGRNLKKKEAHITLPEVITLLSEQSKGQVKIEHALAPDCEHTMCAFHCRYFVDKNLNLQYIHDERQKDNPYKKKDTVTQDTAHKANSTSETMTKNTSTEETLTNTVQKNTLEILQNAPKRSIESVIRSWKGEEKSSDKDNFSSNAENLSTLDAFDAFLEKARKHIFSITCMAFQDVHTLDLQRLQQCCIHVYAQKNGSHALVPFCAYNLTSLSGEALHRNEDSKSK